MHTFAFPALHAIEAESQWLDSLDGFTRLTLGTLGGNRITVAAVLTVLGMLALTWAAARLTERLIKRAAERRATAGDDYSVAYAVGRLSRYAVWIIGVLIGLDAAGINLSNFALLGGAIGVGLGFGLQNVVSNFVSGIIVLMERSLKVGDFVDLQSGVRGHVREIALRFTRVTTNDSVDILVPNSEFVNSRVINWTFDESNRRMHIPFTVAYGSDKNLVREAGVAAALSVEGVLRDQPQRRPNVWLVGFGDNALNFELIVWVDRDRLVSPASTQAKLMWALDDELAARGLEIPFPQRDLHVRSGSLEVRLSGGSVPAAPDSRAQRPS